MQWYFERSCSKYTCFRVRVEMEKQSKQRGREWRVLVGAWAGVAFEQGSFVKHILPQSTAYGIHQMPYYIFNEVHCIAPHRDCLCIHMSGRNASISCDRIDTCVNRKVHWQPLFRVVSQLQPCWVGGCLVVIGLMVMVVWYGVKKRNQ